MNKKVLFLGAGGHAKVLVEMAMQEQREIVGLIAPAQPEGPQLSAITYLQSDDAVLGYAVDAIELVNAIGSLPMQSNRRKALYQHFSTLGYSFATMVSAQAIVSRFAVLDEGAQVMPGVILNACEVGANSIINTGAIVEHDTTIGQHCHIAPGAILCGNVRLDDDVHIGAGATVIQGVSIGRGAVIGAGSVVTNNILAHSVHYPARPFTKRDGT